MNRHLTRALIAVALAVTPLAAGCKKSSDTAGTSPRAADAVTLPLAPRAVGIKWTKIDDTTTDLEIAAGEERVKVGGTRHYRTDHEILEVGADGLVTRLAITYVERVDRKVDPAPTEQPSAIAGKSYIVWVEGDKVGATHADGSPVSPEELAEITADQDELGKPPVLEQLMARTWKIGEKVELTAEELARLADEKGPGPSATEMSLTLERVVGDAAEFAMTMKMQDADKAMTIDVSGTVSVDVRNGRPMRVDIAGPVSGTAGGMQVSGTMKGVVTYQFTRG